MDFKHYEEIASRVRADIVKAVHKAGSGHPGGSLSAADIVTALYFVQGACRSGAVCGAGGERLFPGCGYDESAQAGQPVSGTPEPR